MFPEQTAGVFLFCFVLFFCSTNWNWCLKNSKFHGNCVLIPLLPGNTKLLSVWISSDYNWAAFNQRAFTLHVSVFVGWFRLYRSDSSTRPLESNTKPLQEVHPQFPKVRQKHINITNLNEDVLKTIVYIWNMIITLVYQLFLTSNHPQKECLA